MGKAWVCLSAGVLEKPMEGLERGAQALISLVQTQVHLL